MYDKVCPWVYLIISHRRVSTNEWSIGISKYLIIEGIEIEVP